MRYRSLRCDSTLLYFALVIAVGTFAATTASAQTAPPAGANSSGGTPPGSARAWRPTARKATQRQSSPDKPNAGRSAKATPASAANGPNVPPAEGPSNDSASATVQAPPVQTRVLATRADLGDCDYWIVSSRNCGGLNASSDAGRCLLYLHRTSEQNLIREQRETFLASVRPNRPVCFVMHGSYNRWGDVMSESRKIHRWLRSAAPESPLQVVFFTWPSDGNMPFIFPVDIAILGRRSAAHGAYLASLISQLPADQKVAIVGHSHGARTAAAALHLLGGGALEEGPSFPAGSSHPQQVRAVLIAAALDHNWLNPGQRYGQALLVPERVLLMRNSRDSTLAIYPMRKIMGERALGKDGLGQDDRFALGSLGPKVVELNAAEFADWHHSFADFHQRPELAKALLPFVYFQEEPGAPQPGPTPTTAPGPTITPNGVSTDPPVSDTIRIAPAAKQPQAQLEADSSSDKQRASESSPAKPNAESNAPQLRRNFIELELDP